MSKPPEKMLKSELIDLLENAVLELAGQRKETHDANFANIELKKTVARHEITIEKLQNRKDDHYENSLALLKIAKTAVNIIDL